MCRKVRKKMAYMTGLGALPRSSGELIFNDDWERRIFSIGVALCEKGEFNWDDFKGNLIVAIDDSECHDPEGCSYYECWLSAIETMLHENGLAQLGDKKAI
jgi:nitrile hydratase accessory protein